MCRIRKDTTWRTVLWPCQVNNSFTTIFNTTILLIKQVLEQQEIICSNREEDLTKFGSMVGVDIIENMEMAKVILESICSTLSRSRSGIQSTQSIFRLVKYGDSERGQAREQIRYEDVIVGLANIPVVKDDNCLPLKNNVEYIWARFMQANKTIKRLMTIFFINLDLASMQEHLSYKDMDEMKALLTELLYGKII